MKMYRGKLIPENYEELCGMWEKYYNENEKYPNSIICNIDKSLPSWWRVKQVCGENFQLFCDRYSLGYHPKTEKYEDYCEMIREFAKELGRTPTIKEIRESNKGIPEYRWMVGNAPNNIKSFNDLISYIGLKPQYNVTKEMATKLVLDKIKRNNGIIKAEDFDNPNENEIGHGTIKRIWGSFNEMLIDLNIPINQVGMSTLAKSLSQLEYEIKKLCEHLHKINGHKHIALSDISECEWCSSHGTYNRIFLKEYNMTIGEYISRLGYIPNEAGMGMIYKFDDGELTTSRYEYDFSNLLRNNKIKYTRNVKYKDFINDYDGNKDCDYVIEFDNTEYYIEIAGMLRDSKSIEHTKTLKLDYIHQKYFNDLLEKEEMLKKSKLNYHIIFPYQFNDVDFLMSLISYSKSS